MFEANFDRAQLARTPCPKGALLHDYLSHIRLLNSSLSDKTRCILQDIKAGRTKYYQFRDLPGSDHPPSTPVEYSSDLSQPSYEYEGIIGAISLELGTLFNYHETGSSLIYDIYPVRDFENSMSFVSSKRMLSFHTDGSAHPLIYPEFVLLFCVRDEPTAVNLVVEVDVLIDFLSSGDVEILSSPLFDHLVSQSPERYLRRPILYRQQSRFSARYDADTTLPVTRDAETAQTKLNEMLERCKFVIRNYSNSLLILNNTECLHSRSSFTARYDGSDRWIKCGFVTSKAVSAGSIITPSFE